MNRSYPALQLLIIASKFIGIGVALCGTIVGVLILVGGIALGDANAPELARALGLLGAGFGVLVIVGSMLAGLLLVATGEWIDLHVNLELNTRPRGEFAPPDDELAGSPDHRSACCRHLCSIVFAQLPPTLYCASNVVSA